ncbi:MAG: beta-ketoacyl synthase N-terminal-like domain-containing protein, partial [Phycisphaerales bacterium]|nr:beta-ketoacyl synthase N-terminal-like domain-containing protein [Phycisphaerales bacterium]
AEGYGIVVLERAAGAASRGQAARARVAGWGESADAHHLTQPHPEGTGALAAMNQALARAGVPPRELGMVAAHATGTPDNDGAEFAALSRLLGNDLPRVPVVGFKSFLGHTLGGAGAVELVMSSMVLRDWRVPACPNVRAEDVEFPGLRVTSGRSVALGSGATLNTSLGFGGANTCVVLTTPQHLALPVLPAAGPDAWITGVGVVLPGAVGHAPFVERTLGRGAWNGAGVDDASITEYLNVRRSRRMSQYVKATLAAATMALRDAGLSNRPDRTASAAAILGTMHGSACFCYEYYAQIVSEGALAANPVLFAEGVPNAAAAHLSTTLGVQGACQTIIGSRTAGLDALALAALRVRSGAVETVIVVAAEEPCPVVEMAYRARGMQASEGERPLPPNQRAFQSVGGGVAFVLESSVTAAARGFVPYAAVLGSAWATSNAGGAAANVASVVARLGEPVRLIGSACGTWIDRAERIGVRRAGLRAELVTIADRFAEAFSVTALIGIATELSGGQSGERFASLCTDWTGAASGVGLQRLGRRLERAQT